MTQAVGRRRWKFPTIAGGALIIAASCVFSCRWYTRTRIESGIETANVEGTTIAVRALPGYCNEVDRAFFSPLEQTDPSREVIAVGAPCQDLEAFKTNRTAGLQKYIVWSVGPKDNGTLRRVPGEISRSNFADSMAQDAQKKLDLAAIPSEVANNGSKIGIIDQGLIDREADAVYQGLVLSGDNGEKIVACVSGVAEIHQFALEITAYDKFRGIASLSELLGSVKSLMHAALSDNSEK